MRLSISHPEHLTSNVYSIFIFTCVYSIFIIIFAARQYPTSSYWDVSLTEVPNFDKFFQALSSAYKIFDYVQKSIFNYFLNFSESIFNIKHYHQVNPAPEVFFCTSFKSDLPHFFRWDSETWLCKSDARWWTIPAQKFLTWKRCLRNMKMIKLYIAFEMSNIFHKLGYFQIEIPISHANLIWFSSENCTIHFSRTG